MGKCGYRIVLLVFLLVLGVSILAVDCIAQPTETQESTNANNEGQASSQSSLLETFFGVLIVAFIVERIIEWFFSAYEYKNPEPEIASEEQIAKMDDIGKKQVEEDKKGRKKRNLAKRFISLIIGLVFGGAIVWYFIPTVPTVGLLHAAGLAQPGQLIWADIIITAIAVAGGTKPIHEFIDGLTAQGDNKKESG